MLFGAFSVAFFLLLCQGARIALVKPGQILCNSRGAFGIDIPTGVLLIATFGILILFGVQWWKEKHPVLVWVWVVLFSGGLSNFLERIVRGCVTDYMRVGAFPMFNLADVLLTLGALGILWWVGIKKRNF